MIPKEKAQELIVNTGRFVDMINNRGQIDHDLWNKRTKDICISFCDSVINDYKSYRVKPWLTVEQANDISKYWQEVKKEIENI